jgi:hypothetical protein
MTIPHPTYPLQLEQRAAVLLATQEGAGPEAIRAIKRRFDEQRTRLDPEWLNRYNEAVEQWATANGACA